MSITKLLNNTDDETLNALRSKLKLLRDFICKHLPASDKNILVKQLVSCSNYDDKLLLDIFNQFELLQKYLESSPVGIYQAKADGSSTYCNQATASLTGHKTSEECKGFSGAKYLHPEDRSYVLEEWRNALEHGEDFSSEYRFLHPDGKVVWVLGQAKPTNTTTQENLLIGTITNITKLKQAELKLKQAYQQLNHFTRLNLLANLAWSIAHELNQPLTSIINYAQIALTYIQSADINKNLPIALHKLIEQACRASSMMEQLRTMSQKDKHAKTHFDINTVIRHCLDTIKATAIKKNVKLTFSSASPAIYLDGFEEQISQVIINILINAIEASHSRQHTNVKVTTRVANNTIVQIDIADNGDGIHQANISKLFNPFFTTKENGTGIGLALCKSIIEAHNGELEVILQKNWTVFRISLQVCNNDPTQKSKSLHSR